MLSLNNVKDLIDAKPEDVRISIDELGIDIKSISEETYKESLVDHLKNVYKERLVRDKVGDEDYEEFHKVSKLYCDNVFNKEVRKTIRKEYSKYFHRPDPEYLSLWSNEDPRLNIPKYTDVRQDDIITILTDKIMESMKCLDFSKRSASLKI